MFVGSVVAGIVDDPRLAGLFRRPSMVLDGQMTARWRGHSCGEPRTDVAEAMSLMNQASIIACPRRARHLGGAAQVCRRRPKQLSPEAMIERRPASSRAVQTVVLLIRVVQDLFCR